MMKKPDIEIKYEEASLDEVATFFVEAYKFPRAHELVKHEFFFDPVKGVFVFKLYLQPE